VVLLNMGVIWMATGISVHHNSSPFTDITDTGLTLLAFTVITGMELFVLYSARAFLLT
jgi:hypothetical protein